MRDVTRLEVVLAPFVGEVSYASELCRYKTSLFDDTRILIAPYEERDKWELNVMRLGDTIYLEEHATDQALAQKENMNEHQRKQTYYGY